MEDMTDGRILNHGSQETIRNGNNNLHHGSSDSVVNEPFYDLPEGEDYMAIYETIDRKRQEAKEMKIRSASMEELETPNASLKSFNIESDSVTANCKAEPQIAREKKRQRSKSGSKVEHRKSIPEPLPGITVNNIHWKYYRGLVFLQDSMTRPIQRWRSSLRKLSG